MGVFLRDREDRSTTAKSVNPYIPPINIIRPLTAAAARMKVNDKLETEKLQKRRAQTAWQDEAWEYYDLIGEIKYAFMLTGAVMSRMKLFIAYAESSGAAPSELGSVKDLPEGYREAAENHFRRLGTGHGGVAGMLREASLNLSVAGECYLLQEPERPASGIPEQWTIRSVNEVEANTNGLHLRETRALGGQAGLVPIRPDSFIGRIWRPHPRYHDEADSSMKALLGMCDELLLLNRTARATAKSRLNAGALFIPDGLSVAASPDQINSEGDFEAEDDDAFEEELIAAMTTPIQDEDSASAVVPLLIRGPADLGSQIRPIKFERSFDPALVDRSDRVLERILQGIDVPKDIVTGLASVKYSNAVQINQSLYRAHIEPLTLVIVDALTMIFLRPALRALGFPEDTISKTYIWYDPTDILTSADRAQHADIGFDKYLLSGEAWRSAHGFAETDAPTGDELLKRIVVSRGQVAPELMESVFQQIAPEVTGAIRAQNIGEGATPFPAGLQQMLETGGAPAPEGEQGEPIPQEILDGLPLPGVPAQAPAPAPAPEAGPEQVAPQ
jgi:hypothetical protein